MNAPKWAICFVFMGAVSIQPVRGQAVVSARSGLVHYFEGAVYVADRPLESHLGKYTSIPEGGELRTEHGRAEVLLTPGVFLRVGENTTIRMINNALADTKLELVAGSAILDSLDAGSGRLATLIYKSWTLTQTQKGVYRLDTAPPRVVVHEGEVDVVGDSGSSPVSVHGGMEMPFAAVLAPEKASGETRDALNDWADGRSQSVAADNEIAGNIQDPGTMPASDLLPDSFTYYPMLGIPSYTSSLSGIGSLGLYGSSSVYPGFYSIYLPGYTRPPSFLGLRGIGGIGGLGLQHPLTPPSRVVSPISPVRSPIGHPTPVHPGAPGGVRVGGRR